MSKSEYRLKYPQGNAAIIAVAVIIVIAAVAAFVYSRQSTPTPTTNTVSSETAHDETGEHEETGDHEEPTTIPDSMTNGSTTTSGTNPVPSDDASVKTFTVTGRSFSFSPNEIRVKKGDRVKINFVNESGFHDWVIDEFNARTNKISGGQSETIEFVADKTGTFEFYCSVGNHRQAGMKGNLIVE